MSMNKYDRMLHILNLLRTRRNLNAQRLADECGVTERSIYRDIISLSEMNVPIYYDNGYKLASDNFLPPLNFSHDEYHLLNLALDSSPLAKTGSYADVFRGLKAKIESCVSEQVRKEARFSSRTTHIENPLPSAKDKGNRFYNLLEKAISTCHRIRLGYDSVSSGLSERSVDPYFIVFRARAFYFVAFCHQRQEFRTFRIDRIASLEVLSETFAKDPNIRPETYFEGSWSVFSGQPVEVVVVFRGQAARIVNSGMHHPGEKVDRLSDGSVRYTVTTRGVEEIERWILGFGEQAEVIQPVTLRNSLRRTGEYLFRQYD